MTSPTRLSGRVHQQDILISATTLIESPTGADYCELDELHLLGRLHTLIPEVNQFCITISRLINRQITGTGASNGKDAPIKLGEVHIWRNQINVELGLTARQFDHLASMVSKKRLTSVTIGYDKDHKADSHQLTYFQAGTDPDHVMRDDPNLLDRDFASYQWGKELTKTDEY